MTKNKIVLSFALLILSFLAFNYFSPIKNYIFTLTHDTRLFFVNQYERVHHNIQRHINQTNQIKELENELKLLREPAQISTVLATKLNQLLDESNLTAYQPHLKLARAISFEELNNPYRVWIEFDGFDENRSYGLIHKGYTAGIVYANMGKALAYLQQDKKVIYSVFIGEKKLLGVIFGNEKNLLIRYIPSHANVQIGDEVITSGKDNIFYEGIKVGKIISLETKGIYKVAIVKPYMQNKRANFFYIVDVN